MWEILFGMIPEVSKKVEISRLGPGWARHNQFFEGMFEMKKLSIGLLAALAMSFLIVAAVSADPCPTEKAKAAEGCAKVCPSAAAGKACGEKAASMGECCIESALAGEGCCGMTAEQVKEAYNSCPHVKTVKAEMHPCCVESMDAGKGCCGKNPEALKTDFKKRIQTEEKKVAAK